MSPWVVFAWKFGAVDPNRNRGCSAGVARNLRKTGETCLLAKEDRAFARRVVCVVARNALRAKEVAMIMEMFESVKLDSMEIVDYHLWRQPFLS